MTCSKQFILLFKLNVFHLKKFSFAVQYAI